MSIFFLIESKKLEYEKVTFNKEAHSGDLT